MDELAKAIQKKYIEDITKRYPLHRFFIAFIVIISSYIYSTGEHVTLISNLSNIKINFILDFNKGLLASVNCQQLAISLLATAVISRLYSKLSNVSFELLSKASSFDQYINQIIKKIEDKKSSKEVLNYFLAKDISKELDGLRSKLKSYHTNAEVSVTFLFCIVWGWSSNSYIDWIVVTLLFAFVIYNLWASFNYYISDFLPYYITEQTLLGAKVKFGDM
ncbi:hypothetical protein [Plesiomonas shigelloides]|uniref:hypothetical protein n=1 Tax=Plesiomonas shigelloides TaxID=703 RepID=UPI0012628843|nr:hypothetical protein [Plesiomonas shigelloides]KAB7691470.1 hypothetical protein GBN28_04325 [Plesiomonas shigelloides]